MKPIYVHIAYSTCSTDRKLTCVGDCDVTFYEGKDGLNELKAAILKNIQEDFPEKDWAALTITCINELSEELFFRMYPERRPRVFGREKIEFALAVNDGNRRKAAADLGISERTIYRKMKEYGIA